MSCKVRVVRSRSPETTVSDLRIAPLHALLHFQMARRPPRAFTGRPGSSRWSVGRPTSFFRPSRSPVTFASERRRLTDPPATRGAASKTGELAYVAAVGGRLLLTPLP